MTRIRYTMSARSQGKLYIQRAMTRLAEKDAHRWLTTRLDSFYCDLQVMYMPPSAPRSAARTHIVLNNTPPLHTMAENDEARVVDARGGLRDVVKALIKATGLNPHLSVCGWPFCLDDMKGRAI